MPNVEQILLDPAIACSEEELARFKSISMTMHIDLDTTLGLLGHPDQIVLIEDFKRMLPSILTDAGKSADGCPSYTYVTGVSGSINYRFLAANPDLTNKSVVISSAKFISDLTCYEEYQVSTGSIDKWSADARVQISLDFVEKMLLILALTRRYNILHETPTVPKDMQRLINATATFMYAIYLNIIINKKF